MRRPLCVRSGIDLVRSKRRTSARQTHKKRLMPGYLALLSAITALLLAATACSGDSSGGSTETLVMASSGPWTTTQNNPWAANFVPATGDFVYMPLAVQNWPSLTKFTPRLATDWSVQGNKLVVNLRQGVKWQDGTSVTSTDVIDTMYLNGLTGAAIWSDISDVSAPKSHRVVLTARPKVPMVLLENDLFNGIVPRPASVWGKYVTPSLKHDVDAYFSQAVTDPSGATAGTAYKNMTAALKTLTKYKPKTVVGNGPYKLSGVNTNEVKLVKWDGYYDAKHITISQISFLGAEQPQVNADLLSGRAEFSSGWLYMPQNIVEQWKKSPDAHLVSIPGTFQAEVIFNDHESPYTETKVRRALLYALPLQRMDELSWGKVQPHAVTPDIPDGLISAIEAQFLTKQQLASLNPYHYSQTQAAHLLTSAGFHKSGGQWILPNGKPWRLTIEIDAAWTDQVAAFKVASSALTAFGIKTTLSTVENATYLDDMHKGNFHIAAYCCAGGNPNPILDFAQSPIGSPENFTSTGQRGIGFGPEAVVPGLGKVNIPQTLDQQSHQVGPGSEMNRLTWTWAKFVNDQVPYIEYTDFANQIAYSSKKFTWPSESDPLWKLNNSEAIIIGQQKGLIHPR